MLKLLPQVLVDLVVLLFLLWARLELAKEEEQGGVNVFLFTCILIVSVTSAG